MKKFAKIALSALMLAGAATAVAATPASARVTVGIGIGGGYYGPAYYPSYSCDRYSRFYDPYRCGYVEPYYGPAYYGGPIFSFGFSDSFRGGDFHGGSRGGFHGHR